MLYKRKAHGDSVKIRVMSIVFSNRVHLYPVLTQRFLEAEEFTVGLKILPICRMFPPYVVLSLLQHFLAVVSNYCAFRRYHGVGDLILILFNDRLLLNR